MPGRSQPRLCCSHASGAPGHSKLAHIQTRNSLCPRASSSFYYSRNHKTFRREKQNKSLQDNPGPQPSLPSRLSPPHLRSCPCQPRRTAAPSLGPSSAASPTPPARAGQPAFLPSCLPPRPDGRSLPRDAVMPRGDARQRPSIPRPEGTIPKASSGSFIAWHLGPGSSEKQSF